MLRMRLTSLICFFFNDTATTEIYTLSLHDALPISRTIDVVQSVQDTSGTTVQVGALTGRVTSIDRRSEEHTSELQSRPHLVCRLLLEKKKTNTLLCSKCMDSSSVDAVSSATSMILL